MSTKNFYKKRMIVTILLSVFGGLSIIAIVLFFTKYFVAGVALSAAAIGFLIAGLSIRKTETYKGEYGETKVTEMLLSIADKYGGKVIEDVIIPTKSGQTTQIDHIYFSKVGVFVIETKNYSGRVYGDEKQTYWTQVLAYGNTKNKLYNPLKQNATHIYNLKWLLDNTMECISCVVFVQGNIGYIDANNVCTLRSLRKFIIESLKNRDALYNESRIELAYKMVFYFVENPVSTAEEHVRNIKNLERSLEEGICPRCGGKLVRRKSKNGNEFIGCSNYPECKFIKRS